MTRFGAALLATTRTEGNSHFAMLSGLAEGLAAQGIRAEVFSLGLDGSGLDALLARAAQAFADPTERTFLVDLNARLRIPALRRLRTVAFLIDNPYAHLERLAELPYDALITYVDRGHLPLLEGLGFPQAKLFLPHGGPEPLAEPVPPPDRDIPLLFVGRLEHSPHLDDLRRNLAESEPLVREIIQETAQAAARGEPLFQAFATACRSRGVAPRDFGIEGIGTALRIAHHYAEARGRLNLLSALDGLPVTVVGDVMPGFFEKPPAAFDFLGPRPFAECLAMLGRARLLLNSVTVFPEGSHERVWHAMAAGCAVATDRSGFVAEDFRDGENILFWPREPAAIRALAERALDDPAGLQAIAAAARPIHAARHTWRERAGRLLSALRS